MKHCSTSLHKLTTQDIIFSGFEEPGPEDLGTQDPGTQIDQGTQIDYGLQFPFQQKCSSNFPFQQKCSSNFNTDQSEPSQMTSLQF